ncbi:portal protein [Primorskyibacter sp. S87]|uniref:portal protein n=1 Tax=Primorskyibacter sp. S87 TaxID=3415126 RepID=UPI003C7D85B0
MAKPASKRYGIQQSQTDYRLGSAIREELTRAEGYDGNELDANRQKSMNYYFARPRGDEIAGRSQMISPDVSQMVNAVSAQLLPMLTTDASVTFKASGADDAESAKAESLAVSDQIMEHNEGFMCIQEAIRDALLSRNGVVKVDVEDDVQTLTITVPDNASDAEVAILLVPAAPNETREINEAGNKIKVTRVNRSFTIASPPIEHMVWRANWPSRDLEQVPFIAERVYYTRSDLVELGVSKKTADALPSMDSERHTDTSRNRSTQPAFEAATREMDVIECYWAYILYDSDNDGIAERHKVLLAGEDIVLSDEVVEWVPYAIGSCYITAHRLTGESLADHTYYVQDGKTWVLRQWMDNLAFVNHGRVVYHPTETNGRDVNSKILNHPIRSNNPANVHQFTYQDTGPSNLAALKYYDERRTESGGAALDQLGANMQIAGETAHGVERQYAAKELMVAMFAANFAETVLKPLWLCMHKTMRTFANAPIEMEISDQWVTVDPTQWPERKRAKVTAGLSVGQRMHIQNSLQQSIQIHMAAQQQGKTGILSDDQTLYRTLTRWLQLAGVEDPDSFWIDPSSPQAQQAAQQMQAMAQQQQQQQQQMQETVYASQLQLEADKLAAEMQRFREEIQFKREEAALKAEIEEAKIVGNATTELEKQQNEILNRENSNREASASAGGSIAGNGGTEQ